ncbi:unnamed protein product [Paramecium pentaurelia]|uniref:Transmembrane protein n=1 Tax=Paramecium pentaurelia TaxID=43138 RepID=A0A8S1RZL8_9CILI|nr:unnamed protein product [Paramecium pentaurelia]
MRRLLEKVTGKENTNSTNKDQSEQDTKISLNEIMEEEAHYEIDEDDKLYYQDVLKFEAQKAKLWTKPDFQSHLLVYTKLKYNKELTTEKLSSYRVYKRLYNDKIKNSKDLTIYEKVLFHPDLTQLDYEYIQEENRKVVKNAGIIEITAIGGLGYCYFKTNLRNKKGFYGVFMLAPAFVLFGGYTFEKYRFLRKLYNVELDKKYNIPS